MIEKIPLGDHGPGGCGRRRAAARGTASGALRQPFGLVLRAVWVLAPMASLAQPATAAEPAASAVTQTITVTANRRAQEAQKGSGVVQSIDGEQLRKDGITELRQVQTAVPGLSIAN